MAANHKKKRGRRSKKTSAIQSKLEEAYAVENPVQGLEALMTKKIKQSTSSELAVVTIQHVSKLSKPQLQVCMDIFESNMAKLYQESHWGLNLKEKENELLHDKARFLIATLEESKEEENTENEENNRDNIIGFCHYRFDVNDDDSPTEPVLYVYELQVLQPHQHVGLGRCLMSILELMSRKLQLPKVMLTVFHSNTKAMKFYRDKMKYQVDETSPSQFVEEEADYEILSKAVL